MNTDAIQEYEVFGTRFRLLDPDSSVPAETMPGQIYEPGVAAMLKKVLSAQPLCFVDIGSHYGYYPVLVGTLHPGCTIHAFEPGASYANVCRRNLSLNDVRATVHEVALSDSSGPVAFRGRTMKVTDETGSSLVQSETFDDYALRQEIVPDVAKIDVHGAEGKVLFGMGKTLRNIQHLFVEVHARHLMLGYDYREILDHLKASGLVVYEILRFRFESEPRLQILTGASYDSFVDFEKWTDEQKRFERMLYATRESSHINTISR